MTAASKMRQFCPTLLGIGLGALVFAVVAIATAPGIYSPDSVGQLLEAQRGVYEDGHPRHEHEALHRDQVQSRAFTGSLIRRNGRGPGTSVRRRHTIWSKAGR